MSALALALLLAAQAEGAAAGPSFDCARAASAADRRVCDDPVLAAQDRAMAGRYAEALAASRDPVDVRAEQRQALRRRAQCPDAACLRRWYDRRLVALQLPVGACVDTRVASRGSRLQGVPGSGTSVSYADGRVGVSYASVPAVADSRPGDPIRLCLVSRPPHCPPGDDRGAMWRALNRRTGAGWTLPDSEHQCGGA